jgi:competence/damage-inducible protein CinA-like protein
VNAEIIAIGSELLTPFRQDTNSLYLTEKLNELGVDVLFKTIVGDRPEHLTGAALLALSRADISVFMGGLGPTEDDLTREAVADALGLSLRRDPEIVASIEHRFAAHGWKMSANNAKQGDVITGATVLPNPGGTAPGQWISGQYKGQDRIILLLPGPPHEMKAVFDEQCMERLRAKLPPQFIATRVLKIAMMGESQCDARAAPIYKRARDVETTILAGRGEVQLHLRTQGASLDAAQQRVDRLVAELEEELGDFVFSDNGESLEQIAGYYLQMRGATLAVAESCSGRAEEQLRRCADRADQHPRRRQPRGRGGAGGGNSRPVWCDSGGGHHGSGRAERRNSGKTGGARIPRLGQRRTDRSDRTQVPRRPRPRSLVLYATGPRYGEKETDVRQLVGHGSPGVANQGAHSD